MNLRNDWLSALTQEFANSPLAITFSFGLIQMVLEKLVEVEFACPCNSEYNCSHTSVYFFVPPFIVFSLICVIKYQCTSHSLCTSQPVCQVFNSAIISATIWLVIVFLDGRYYACAKTDWSGKYEIIENAEPQRWCQESNSSQELLAKTQLWYSESQYIGFWTAFGLTIFYLVCPSSSDKCTEIQSNEGNKDSSKDLKGN